jgi:hypothetical protein
MFISVHPGHTKLNGRISDREYYRFKCAEREVNYERLRISVFCNDSRLPQSEAVYLVPLGVGPEVYSLINAHLCNWMRDNAERKEPIYSWVLPVKKQDGRYRRAV